MPKADYEYIIKRVLEAQRRPLSTRQIATKTHTTWPTAKKHLNEMKKQGHLTAFPSNNRIYWKPVYVREHTRHTDSGRTTRVRQHRRRETRNRTDW